jgi:peptide/nickel transport system substrate-binding protein
VNFTAVKWTMALFVIAALALAACSGETVTVEVPGETITVEVPGETVTVEVPGETVTVEVVREVVVVATAVAAPLPAANSVLRIGNSGEVQFMDAAKSQSGTDIIFSEFMYSRLLQYDATMMDPKPDIAESWTTSADGKTYTFKIRNDVKFHNGKALTAEDIEFSWDRCRNEIADRGRCKGELNDVTSFEATGTYEFTVVLAGATPVFIPSMAHWSLAILDKDTVADLDTKPIGTGPYKFVEQIPGDRLVLEKFDGYFDQDTLNQRPEKVIIVPIADPQTRIAALKAGEIDFAVDLPFEQIASVAATPGLEILAQRDGITASYMTVIFNYKEGPMADLKVRQAVQLAIDPIAINRAIYFGLGVPSCNPILEDHWAYLPFECPTRDVDKAKQLLAEAGYGPGELKIKYMPENIPATQKMAEVIKQNLAEAGIDMEIVIVDSPTWLDKVWFGVECSGADWPVSRCYNGIHKEFDLGDAWYTREPDPDGLMQSLFRADSALDGFKGNNGMRYFSQDIEDLFDLGKSTTDRSIRSKAYLDIVDIIVNRDVPLVKLQSMPRFFAANEHLKDAYVSPKGYWNAKDWAWSN